ncbi:hypothetical protein HBI56_175110 [Parastagonospora nodorum]|nr:hypothetical protein HBH92_198110 [Parastagonospora nodorum]KAH4421308.1 hypothetical protein HBH93_201630 [Parastagonospora nodorum]KAH4434186.1 hypothetical protein HBH91_210720 [Parastagonospora nodorum]KAH4499953.1 hypothetical protein HBH89_121420 [Parastagonospora nodorum]KAH4528721.1 hypothetical protein HBH85_203180 [Parastagonospora nodorum]
MANSKSTPMLRRSIYTCWIWNELFGIKSVRPDGSSGTNHCLFTQACNDTCELLEEYLNLGHATHQVLHDMIYLGTTTSTVFNSHQPIMLADLRIVLQQQVSPFLLRVASWYPFHGNHPTSHRVP